VDGNGMAYVAGMSHSTDFPTLNAYQSVGLGYDAFVAKIDTTKSGSAGLVYSTYLGGHGDDNSSGIAADGSGNAYVVGNTFSSDFPTLNAFQSTYHGKGDAFVAKIDTTKSGNASLVYSTYLGGSDTDGPAGIAVDGSGYAYVTGTTSSTDFPILNPYQTDQPSLDVFVTKLDTTKSGNASLVYSTYLGGNLADIAYGIAVDGSGNAYVTGYTNSPDFPLLNEYSASLGEIDVFVTKLDTTKSGNACLVYSTWVGEGQAEGIAVDGSGNAYVTGITASTDYPTVNQYQDAQPSWDEDAFVTKISPSANADIAVTKTSDNLTPKVGEAFHFTITVRNNGPSGATGLKVADYLPASLIYQSSSASKGFYVLGKGIWDIGTLADGESATLAITVRGTSGGHVTNTASVLALERYNRNLCMEGTSVSYVGSSHLTWTRRGPKGYAHEEDYRKSGRRSNDFGNGDGPGSLDPRRCAEDASIRLG